MDSFSERKESGTVENGNSEIRTFGLKRNKVGEFENEKRNGWPGRKEGQKGVRDNEFNYKLNRRNLTVNRD